MLKIPFFKSKIFVFIIFLLAFLLRSSVLLIAHHGDLNNNISWGQIASDRGLKDFYGSANSDDWPYSAPNQPPLTILTFAAAAKIWEIINDKVTDFNWRYKIFPSKFIWFWEENGWDLLIKLPSLVADILIGYVIYDFLKRKKEKGALFYASVWLFNPLTWYNSSVWGQTDSIVNLLGLLAIISLLKKDLVKFSLWFTLSFLFKASLGVFIPFLVYVLLKQKYKLKVWLKSAFAVMFTAFAITFPFHPEFNLFVWLLNLYRERILPGEIGYLTANAFNFWWLVDPGNVLDSTHYLGMPARVLGIFIVLILILRLIFKLRGKLSHEKIFFGLAVSSLIAFVFMTRIHPRYLYPFFPLATILLVRIPKMVFPFLILSFVHLLNIYYLFWVPDLIVVKSLYGNPVFTNGLSVVFLLSLLYLFQILSGRDYKTDSS